MLVLVVFLTINTFYTKLSKKLLDTKEFYNKKKDEPLDVEKFNIL